ncbi:hypothetical protein RND81_12G114200 [Saponaria officinalis]|uniref:NusG-like N-terminal domain-containing protein n=1 Tax=Saponaria officinalis TaxID=3572 RepID=A0AAW1H9H2_SAPOF
MNQGILQWKPLSQTSITPFSFSIFPSSITFTPKFNSFISISAKLNSIEQQNEEQQQQQELHKLPAKERRKIRNERRQSNAINWKEEVEMKLIKKPKKRYASWTEELNLDNLAHLGPQWWVVRVPRVNGDYIAERLALSLSNTYPDFEFKMYIPAVQEKRKLKNGSISVKSKPLFPGCVFLRCVLNKEMHDFVRERDGVGGFVGSRVGNTKRQINRPRPVAEEDIENIIAQAKEEQEKADLAFQDKLKSDLQSLMPNLDTLTEVVETPLDTNPKSQDKKVTEPSRRGRKSKYPKIGSTVRVVSGSFAEFSGIVKKVDKKNAKITVGFTLLGKDTISDLDIKDVISEE